MNGDSIDGFLTNTKTESIETGIKTIDNNRPRRVEDKENIIVKKKQIDPNSKIYYIPK